MLSIPSKASVPLLRVDPIWEPLTHADACSNSNIGGGLAEPDVGRKLDAHREVARNVPATSRLNWKSSAGE